MATLDGVMDAVIAAVIANTNALAEAGAGQRLSRRFSFSGNKVMREVVAIGQHAGDSNQPYLIGEFTVWMLYSLGSPTNEANYLDGDALDDQAVLMARSFWRNITGVYELIDGPELQRPERIGNVILYSVSAQLAIAP